MLMAIPMQLKAERVMMSSLVEVVLMHSTAGLVMTGWLVELALTA